MVNCAQSDTQLHLLEFVDRKVLPLELCSLRNAARGSLGVGRTDISMKVAAELDAFFAGESDKFETPLHLDGSPFTRSVWAELRLMWMD